MQGNWTSVNKRRRSGFTANEQHLNFMNSGFPDVCSCVSKVQVGCLGISPQLYECRKVVSEFDPSHNTKSVLDSSFIFRHGNDPKHIKNAQHKTVSRRRSSQTQTLISLMRNFVLLEARELFLKTF